MENPWLSMQWEALIYSFGMESAIYLFLTLSQPVPIVYTDKYTSLLKDEHMFHNKPSGLPKHQVPVWILLQPKPKW